MKSRCLLLSTEVIGRELDFQLLVSALVTKSGDVRCFIGRLDALQPVVAAFRDGVLLGRVFSPGPSPDLSAYAALKANGFSFVHLDEEGAVYSGDEASWRRTLDHRLDPSLLGSDDVICTWGDLQRAHYAGGPAAITTTGHPRFDLLLQERRAFYDADVRSLRAELGRFVLVNTSTSVANPAAPLDTMFAERLGYVAEDVEKRRRYLDVWAGQARTVAAFVQLVSRLCAEHPDVRFVIRPHPAEDPLLYEAIFGRAPNVRVLRRGSVAPWLLAAECLIAHNCTTSIEAYFAGTPCINYCPKGDPDEAFMFLPAQFGLSCPTESAAAEAVARILERCPDEGCSRFSGDERAVALLSNLVEPALPKIVSVVREALDRVPARDAPRTREGVGELAARARARVRGLWDEAKFNGRALSPRTRHIREASRQSFPGFGDDVSKRWARLQAITGSRASLIRHGRLMIEIKP